MIMSQLCFSFLIIMLPVVFMTTYSIVVRIVFFVVGVGHDLFGYLSTVHLKVSLVWRS